MRRRDNALYSALSGAIVSSCDSFDEPTEMLTVESVNVGDFMTRVWIYKSDWLSRPEINRHVVVYVGCRSSLRIEKSGFILGTQRFCPNEKKDEKNDQYNGRLREKANYRNGVPLFVFARGGSGSISPTPTPDPHAYAQRFQRVGMAGWEQLCGSSKHSWSDAWFCKLDGQKQQWSIFE